eukprot:TRINITY_DN53220_c0_g1_i1.p1 TRINITY_DN53220_c0_g1~~TRINITY_DN53220_c0_g1_i1.p1  ORF type:complete len:112 (+),score=9.67 TRINITY_DN53220_c0_g1_i1:156-491(+)
MTSRSNSGLPKKVLCCYLITIFTCRLILRCLHARGIHWALAMVLEDALSLLSFAVGLYCLHCCDGAPLVLVGKCIAARSEIAAWAPVAERHSDNDSGMNMEKRIRLFSVAL